MIIVEQSLKHFSFHDPKGLSETRTIQIVHPCIVVDG